MTTTCYRSPVLPRLALHLALLAVAVLAAGPGPARAELFTPSVEARINNNTGTTSASQVSGPVILSDAGAHYAFGVWTDYGTNRAASSVAVSTSYSSPVSWGDAISTWTDALRVSTPDVAAGAPVSLVFSIGLDGHLEGYGTGFTNGGLWVTFGMLLNQHGSWAVQPSYALYLGMGDGGGVSVDVDEVLHGVAVVPNGAWFNLVSTLSTRVMTNLWGPPASISGTSAFDNSARWLGGSVWVDGNPASAFTIESGSGFDYAAPVPEPPELPLFAAGLAGLGVTAWRRWRAADAR
jgi:hypothetical protein